MLAYVDHMKFLIFPSPMNTLYFLQFYIQICSFGGRATRAQPIHQICQFFCKFRWWKKKQFHMVHLCEYENVIITNFYQECGCGWKFLSFLGQSMNFGIFFNSLTHALTFKKMYCNNSVIYGVSLLLIFQATHITAFLVSPCLLWCAQCAKTRKKVHFSAGQCTVCLKG